MAMYTVLQFFRGHGVDYVGIGRRLSARDL